MRSTFAPLALAALAAANPVPQGVNSAISPSSSAPAGCSEDYSGTFQIQIVNVSSSSKRDLVARNNPLEISLSGGVLTDSEGRTGYVAANNQFQFDSPPQTGAIYTAGFSVCQNGSLAIGGDAVWYSCLSGTFYNLYDNNDAGQCNEVYIDVINAGGSAPTTAGTYTTAAATAPASQLTDGQVTASPVPVTQISDGQVQASTAAAVTQISDGQVQAPTGSPVTQISDGQVQAPTGSPVTQISDGQVQAPTGQPVTQISDGQVQAPTGTGVAPVASYTGPAIATGAASGLKAPFGIVAGLMGLAML